MEKAPFILVVCMLFIAGIQGECDSDAVKACFNPNPEFNSVMEKLNERFGIDLYVEKDELDIICRDLEAAKECVGDKPKACSDNLDVLTFQGVLLAFITLCKESNKIKYLHNSQCIRDKDPKALVQQHCAHQEDQGDMCKNTNDMYQCLYEALKAECGQDAADVQLDLVMEQTEPTHTSLDCTVDVKTGSSGAASIRFAWGFLVFPAIVIRFF